MDGERNGDGWWVITFVIGVMALVMGVVGIAIASGRSDASGVSGSSDTAAGVIEFDVTLADISVSPNMIEVPAGKPITVHVTNKGALDHDFKVEGATGTAMLKAGQKADVVIGPFTSDATVWCTVPGHKEGGMKMAVHVVGAANGAETATTVVGSQNATIDGCLLYTSDAADDQLCVDLGGRRIIKKKTSKLPDRHRRYQEYHSILRTYTT